MDVNDERQAAGAIKIVDDAVAAIAAYAALGVPGVVELVSPADLTGVLGRRYLAEGVRIEVSGRNVSAEIFAVVRYGHRIPDVARQVQLHVKETVEVMTGLEVSEVNVNIQSVANIAGKEKEPCE